MSERISNEPAGDVFATERLPPEVLLELQLEDAPVVELDLEEEDEKDRPPAPQVVFEGALDAPAAELVKMRYFAGLTMKQIAEILGVSLRTAENIWAFARTWLYQEMTRND